METSHFGADDLVVAEAVQFAEPGVTFVYDGNGNKAVSSRRAVLGSGPID